MKKNGKRLLSLVLALVMLCLLCGCDALDEMRQYHGFIDLETGYILWNDAVYKPLPFNKYITVDPDEYRFVYATAPDVPVLWSKILADPALMISDDEVILWDGSGDVYYCREDAFEEISGRLRETFVPEIVCYSYSMYDPEKEDFTTHYYTLTQTQIEAIETVIANTEPTVLGQGMRLEYNYSISLQACSKDLLLRENTMDIRVSGNTYYLQLYTNEGTVLFTVPDGCNATFDEIVKAYEQSRGSIAEDADEYM